MSVAGLTFDVAEDGTVAEGGFRLLAALEAMRRAKRPRCCRNWGKGRSKAAAQRRRKRDAEWEAGIGETKTTTRTLWVSRLSEPDEWVDPCA